METKLMIFLVQSVKDGKLTAMEAMAIAAAVETIATAADEELTSLHGTEIMAALRELTREI